MAIKDPNPEFNQMPEMTIETVDYNMFYKPDAKPVSSGLKELSKSLAGLVPSLTNYAITEEIKQSEREKNKAIADYNSNKNAFKQLVKSGKIPEGANPHYFNKMMELDLTNKARQFKNEFDLFASENKLEENLTPDAWNEAYETKLKEFFEREKISNYDQIAQSKAFFNQTSAFRNEREQQFMAKRMAFIQKNTQNNAIKNYAGMFIEAQSDRLSNEELFKQIGAETKSFMDTGTSGERANDLFISGFKKYLEVVNDQEGFDYARQVLDGLGNLKLGTGFFAGDKGRRRNEVVRLELIEELNAKEIEFYEGNKKRNTIKEDVRKQNLELDYFQEYNKEDFDLPTFINQKILDEDSGEIKNKFSNKDKLYFRTLNKAVIESTRVSESSISAIVELENLKDENIYKVRDRALELAKDGQLSLADFKLFSTSAQTKLLYERNIFFLQSAPFQDYMSIFKDKNNSSTQLGIELTAIKNRFTGNVTQWFEENKDDDQYKGKPRAFQKALDAEVKEQLGVVLSGNNQIRGNFQYYKDLFLREYGILIPKPDGME